MRSEDKWSAGRREVTWNDKMVKQDPPMYLGR
jgi:hypothetical protein